MSKIQLVIELDKNEYDYFKNTVFVEDTENILKQSKEDRIKTLAVFDVLNAIKDGTPLPKGDEELIFREDAIGEILKYFTERERAGRYSFTPNLIKQICADILSEMPPATTQRR